MPYTNELVHETSPYLLQHAHNPVQWQAWNDHALSQAKGNKPILLSIGYAACHWCHVMEHESFADPATADIMNRLFVCIKVDREERPDLDKIYQAAHHILTGRPGGWPLNMFLTPVEQLPFFGGTYFPPEARYGMPAFTELLQRVAVFFRDNTAELQQQNSRLRKAFSQIDIANAPHGAEVLNDAPLLQAATDLIAVYDSQHGGFG